LEDFLAATSPEAERHRQAEADRKPEQSFPYIGLQRTQKSPAQHHDREYCTVRDAGNVQASELHVENAAEHQKKEDQQHAEPQPLERRGVVHWHGNGRTRVRRAREWLTVVCGCGHRCKLPVEAVLLAVSDSTTRTSARWGM
jgi:hypothetical protein